MKYEEFKRELYRNVLQRRETAGKQIRLLERQCICADTYTVRLAKMCNSALYGRSEAYVREDMLCIAWGEWEMLRMLYWHIGALYERFQKEGWQAVLPGILLKLQEEQAAQASEPESGRVLERLIIRPMNYQYNQSELKNSVYWRFGDIALALHMLLYESGEEYASMMCSRDTIRRAGLPDEAVMVNALLQTCAMTPPRLYHSGDLRRYFDKRIGIFMPGERGEEIEIHRGDIEEGMRGYRLTNVRGTEGSSAIFYPGVQERLAELMGGDYYVGFPNIDEAVIHPARYKSQNDMKAAIYRVNSTLSRRQALTTKVYRYNCRRDRLFEV